jgi:hypothetical protein
MCIPLSYYTCAHDNRPASFSVVFAIIVIVETTIRPLAHRDRIFNPSPSRHRICTARIDHYSTNTLALPLL